MLHGSNMLDNEKLYGKATHESSHHAADDFSNTENGSYFGFKFGPHGCT